MNIALRSLLPVILVAIVSCSRQASITRVPEREDSVASRRLASLEGVLGHNNRCDWKYDLPDGMKMELAVETNESGNWTTERVFAFPAESTGPTSGLISLEYSFNPPWGADAHKGFMLQTQIQAPRQTWARPFSWVGTMPRPSSIEFAPMPVDPQKLSDPQTLWTLSVTVDGKPQPTERATIRLTKK